MAGNQKGWNRTSKKKHWIPSPEYFWKKVVVRLGQCWEWQGWRVRGYGKVRPTSPAKRREFAILGAHRVSWELTNGPIPPGMLVLHTCDNPACVCPKHLFLGTDQDNVSDKENKGRAHYQRCA